MTRRLTIFLLQGLLILFWIVISKPGFAGIMIEQVVRDRQGEPSNVILFYSDHQFRKERPAGGLAEIRDFKEGRIVFIDHQSKRYVIAKLSEWEKEVVRRLKQEFPSIKIEGKKIDIKKTGRTAVINGFQTEQVEVWAGNMLIEEDWMTRDVEMKECERVMDREAKVFSKDFRLGTEEAYKIYEKLKPYGYPVLVKDYTVTYGLGAIDLIEVKKIEKKELQEDIFLPPAGYQRFIPKSKEK